MDTIFHTSAIAPKMLNLSRNINFQEISMKDIEKISTLKTPQEVIGLVKIPLWPTLNYNSLKHRFSLVLDNVQDPGNMGTIIRTADWFGIADIICSEDTVDVYNPKVVQATMGSLARVNVHYVILEQVLPQIKLPLFGAMLDGENIYNTAFGGEGLLVMGNEGNGISPAIERLISTKITIPRAGKAESLNVAIATAILCSEIKRNSMK